VRESRRTDLALEARSERRRAELHAEVRQARDGRVGDEGDAVCRVAREVGARDGDAGEAVKGAEADVLAERDVVEDGGERVHAQLVGRDGPGEAAGERRGGGQCTTGWREPAASETHSGLRSRSVAKSVNWPLLRIVSVAVVVKLGTPLPPELQMGGSERSAM